ncbi:mCG1027673, partial [Mus musculus]
LKSKLSILAGKIKWQDHVSTHRKQWMTDHVVSIHGKQWMTDLTLLACWVLYGTRNGPAYLYMEACFPGTCRSCVVGDMHYQGICQNSDG